MIILHKELANTKSIDHLVKHYHARGYKVSLTTDSEIYIGSYYPFNNFHIEMSETAANGNSSVMSVEYWDGQQFRTAPNFVDETDDAGAALAVSGSVSFVPDELYAWQMQDARYIAEISDQVYYGLYWIRLTFSADLTEDTFIKYIGNVFCSDVELYGRHPRFKTLDWLDNWGQDKVDWLEQRISASDMIIAELKTINKIRSAEQILDRLSLRDACIDMTAYIILMGSGFNYAEEAELAYKSALTLLRSGAVKIDQDNNAIYNKIDTRARLIQWSK
jgi:hypothetical protein